MQNKIIMNEGAQEVLLDVIDNPRTGKGNVELKQAAQDLIKEIINPQAPKFVRGQSYDKIFFDTTIDKDTLHDIFISIIPETSTSGVVPLFNATVTFHNRESENNSVGLEVRLMKNEYAQFLTLAVRYNPKVSIDMLGFACDNVDELWTYEWVKGIKFFNIIKEYLNMDASTIKDKLWEAIALGMFGPTEPLILDEFTDFTYSLSEDIDDSAINGIVFSPSKLKDLDERCAILELH